MQIKIGQCGHGFEDRAWKCGITKAGEGRVNCLLRGLKYQALAEPQLCIALLRSLAGAHRNVLPASHIDNGDAEVRDGRALFARADEHGERAPVDGVSEDEIGLEVVKGHLKAGGLGGDVAR